MKYTEGTITTTLAGLEPVSALLTRLGIDQLVINDPRDVDDLLDKKNSYDWDYIDDGVLALKNAEPSVVFYLPGSPAEYDELFGELRAGLDGLSDGLSDGRTEGSGADSAFALEVKEADDGEWKDRWKEYFKPARITERITVCPSWEEYEPGPGEKVITIDPGQAFGTGTHETTSLCIKLIEKYLKPGDEVLDVGSGSGILSIAACLEGAGRVLGIDIDPVAVETGRENVALNGLSDSVEVIEGDLTKGVEMKADIVVANLMADLVIMLSADCARHLKPGGVFISSGILAELSGKVEKALADSGFEVIETVYDGEWCAIAAKARG